MRQAIVGVLLIYISTVAPQLQSPLEERTVRYMRDTAVDIIQHTNIEVWRVDVMRQTYRYSAPYEIGFLIRTSEERYRKMVDLYNTSVTHDTQLRTRGHILYLQQIEKLHWDIMHLANMLHEVERKYKIVRAFLACLDCLGLDTSERKIMSVLSWGTKTKFLAYLDGQQNKSQAVSTLPAHVRKVRSIYTKMAGRRQWNVTMFQDSTDDDSVMKMKLFRLMYETVKDSDLKIKRAELVKADYENATGFDLGYVVGDVSDKLSVMGDIAQTLKRLYDVWKPLEHVNAYEQIANLAIEVTHLVDMVRVMMTSATGRM